MPRLILSLILAASASSANAADPQTAIFAGGCFWCVEADFDKVPGVIETVSGYTGGAVENPTYAQVSAEDTGHKEAVEITFDAEVTSYAALLDIFWRSVDPIDAGGQFCDRGDSYATAVFTAGPEQQAAAEASREAAAEALGQEIVTEIVPAGDFWPAEDEHQNYADENPLRYSFYRRSCGRDARLRSLWGAEAYIGAKS